MSYALATRLLDAAMEIERCRLSHPYKKECVPAPAQTMRDLFHLPGPAIPSQDWYVPEFRLLCEILEVWKENKTYQTVAELRAEATILVAHIESFDVATATPEQMENMVKLLCRLHACVLGGRQRGRSHPYGRRRLAA